MCYNLRHATCLGKAVNMVLELGPHACTAGPGLSPVEESGPQRCAADSRCWLLALLKP